jgi:hypothetical protein
MTAAEEFHKYDESFNEETGTRPTDQALLKPEFIKFKYPLVARPCPNFSKVGQ